VWRRGGQGGPEETPRGHISSMLEKDPGGWRKVRVGEGTWAGVGIVPKNIVGGSGGYRRLTNTTGAPLG
jgi:hypothetical protein